MTIRSTLFLAWFVLLAACSGPDTRESQPGSWPEHQARLATMDIWTTSGKLALRTAEQAETANLVWQQHDIQSTLKLSGPIGIQSTRVYSDGQRMEIQRGEEVTGFDISSAEAVRRNTGWDFPIQALPHWLKGIPAPGLEVQSLELDALHENLAELQQDGWQILYQDYQNFAGYRLPTRLRIQRSDTTVKIILHDWQPGPRK